MKILRLLKDAIFKFFEDDAITLAGSVAFFTALSMAPLIVILIGIAGFFGEHIHNHLIDEIISLLGSTAGNAIDIVVQHASERKMTGGITAIIGIVTLIFSATGVFVQLQKSMNKIWGIEPRPGREIKEFFRKRLVSLGMVFGIGFLLLVSLTVSAVMAALVSGEGWIWRGVNIGASLLIYYLLFGFILQYLPDARIRWRDVAVGALITAILFNVGKFLIGQYLGKSGIGSAYGAAGSLVIMLVWVYYSALIVFYGTELAVLYTERFGGSFIPNDIARWRDPFRRKPDKNDNAENVEQSGREEDDKAAEESHRNSADDSR